MPDDYKHSANKRPRKVTDEDKKRRQMEMLKMRQKRKYVCPRCHKAITYGSKYCHSKICK